MPQTRQDWLWRALRPGKRRMQPHLQPAEVEPCAVGMTISPSTTTPLGNWSSNTACRSGKVAVERPQVTALDEHVVRAAKHDGGGIRPTWLEQEVAPVRNLLGDLGEHGFDRRRNRHAVTSGAPMFHS